MFVWGYVSNSGWCGALSRRVKTASFKSQVYLYPTLFTLPPPTYSNILREFKFAPVCEGEFSLHGSAVLVLTSKKYIFPNYYWVPAQNCLCERSIRLLFALLEHPSDFPFLLLYVFEEFVFSCPVDVIVRVSEFTGLESRVKLFCLHSVPLLIFLKPFFVLSIAFLARVCSLVSAPISAPVWQSHSSRPQIKKVSLSTKLFSYINSIKPFPQKSRSNKYGSQYHSEQRFPH